MKNVITEFRIWMCNFIIAYIPFHVIRLGYYKHVMNFKIGKGSSIHLGCRFNTPGMFTIKENSTINQFCHIDNRGGVSIGANVSISPKVNFVTADHDIMTADFIGRCAPINIEDYAFIGYGATILPNCIIRTGSVVAATSLVTKSTIPYGVYFGIPAQLKKQRTPNLTYSGKYKRLFH